MKCTNHPHRETNTRCSSCQRPICEDCTATFEGGPPTCVECTMQFTLQAMHQRRSRKIEATFEKTTEQDVKKRKRSHLRIVIPVSAALVIALIELVMLYRVTRITDVAEFKPSEDPTSFAIMVHEAINEYAKDHGGGVPVHLSQLLGKYLPSDKIRPSDLATLVYVQKSPDTYVLTANPAEGRSSPTITVTENGIEAGEGP